MSHRMTETTSPCHLGTWETGHPQENLEMTWEVENWLQHWMQPSHTWPKVEGSLIGSMCLSNTSAHIIGWSLSCAANKWRSWVQNPATASWVCFLFSLHLCLTKSPQSKFCLRLALCTLLTSHSTPNISPVNVNSPKSDTTEYKRASSLTLPLATRCPQVKPNWSLNWKKKSQTVEKNTKPVNLPTWFTQRTGNPTSKEVAGYCCYQLCSHLRCHLWKIFIIVFHFLCAKWKNWEMPNYIVLKNPAIDHLRSYLLFSEDIIDVLPGWWSNIICWQEERLAKRTMFIRAISLQWLIPYSLFFKITHVTGQNSWLAMPWIFQYFYSWK